MGNRENTQGFEQLEVWQKAIDLAVQIYKTTNSFPKSEIYSLTNQMHRASSSISANIAEGYGRHGYKEKLQFYKIANGSLLEIKSFCYLANKLEYITDEDLDLILSMIVPIQKLTNALIKSIRDNHDN
ncbi:MAG TPA: four helix bundle protein [Candidatus Saccharibacteria bacterium]|nr:four helix bundle protein [Candidatus Saccharibacteria bacterium]